MEIKKEKNIEHDRETDNYQYCGPMFLLHSWCSALQIDVSMILVMI